MNRDIKVGDWTMTTPLPEETRKLADSLPVETRRQIECDHNHGKGHGYQGTGRYCERCGAWWQIDALLAAPHQEETTIEQDYAAQTQLITEYETEQLDRSSLDEGDIQPRMIDQGAGLEPNQPKVKS